MSVSFHRYDLEQFELALDRISEAWSRVPNANANEFVYEFPLPDDDLTIRVFSTVDLNSKTARSNGSDAIRTVLWSEEYDRPVGGEKRTNRNKRDRDGEIRWPVLMKKKVEELYANWRDYITTCDCGAYMVQRDGPYGKFLACIECDETLSL